MKQKGGKMDVLLFKTKLGQKMSYSTEIWHGSFFYSLQLGTVENRRQTANSADFFTISRQISLTLWLYKYK